MLIVFDGTPSAAPGETMFDKELITEIISGDLITEVLLAIDIWQTCSWFNDAMPVFFTIPDVRVVERIDVDG